MPTHLDGIDHTVHALRPTHPIAPLISRMGWLALALSLGLHLFALLGVPHLDFPWLRTSETTRQAPIQARIVRPSEPEPVAAQAAPKAVAAAPRPLPKPRPKPAPPVPSTMALESTEPPPAVNEQLRDRNATPEPDVVPPEQVADAATPPATDDPSKPAATATGESTEEKPESKSADSPPKAEPNPVASSVIPELGPPASYPLKSARLVYDLAYGFAGGVVGTVTHTLKIDGANYQVETVVAASGVAAIFYGGRYVQRSRGRLGPNGFVPDEYFVMRGQESRSERATFDWATKKIAFSWPSRDSNAPGGWRIETRTGDLTNGIQDPVSMLHQLYFMQPLAPTARLSIATSRKVSQHAYEVMGEEVLKTPLGEITTIKVRRRDEDSDQLDLWLDPSRNMMPLKIYYEDRRRTVLEQNIREYAVE